MANEDFNIDTVRRKLTPWRNRKGLDNTTKQRLTNLINTAENAHKAEGSYRDQLIRSFEKQWAEFEVHVAN